MRSSIKDYHERGVELSSQLNCAPVAVVENPIAEATAAAAAGNAKRADF